MKNASSNILFITNLDNLEFATSVYRNWPSLYKNFGLRFASSWSVMFSKNFTKFKKNIFDHRELSDQYGKIEDIGIIRHQKTIPQKSLH